MPSSKGATPKDDSAPAGSHESSTSSSEKLTHAPYGSASSSSFESTYSGHCFCGSIRFSLCGDPKSNVFCHCRSCQRLHGAPATLSSIYDKDKVRFTAGVENLVFFSPQEKRDGYRVPCKLSCRFCHSPIGNEGNNMMLVLPALIDFDNPADGHQGPDGRLPDAFKPTFHQYYETKIREIEDDLPKFKYEKNNGPLNDAAVEYKKKSEAEKAAKQESEDLKENPSADSNGKDEKEARESRKRKAKQ
ncbi:Putative uncharacterized protein [Taphrina deformans PYCC 5710]|uniref:CENP-V/GFA domain-containing protein n=1 Tax=Taphrina deformans (strain PYCC 5710 / ATCC 11124 / CBS 356.35 / IMI 108563 / JCM 9778 / NBRC 8474) TaxID=1097556 RepID=R4X8U2_TAPDE|nr:Putative uncharacterized protein [Taphrina deformans PYCC 5710]|eukprot:CCG80532.1 Putative uncharacterized protein [Taphrina deformans PYCC 5710]